jgi:hypothetical protein
MRRLRDAGGRSTLVGMSASGNQGAPAVFETAPITVLRGRSRYHPSARARGEYRRRGQRWKRWVLWISVIGLAGTMWVAYRAAKRYPSRLNLQALDRRRPLESRTRPLELK